MDLTPFFEHPQHLPARTDSALAKRLHNSAILAIFEHVKAMQASGKSVANLTVGDFDPSLFPIPSAFAAAIASAYATGQTHYPPAIGVPQLRQAICTLYAEQLGIAYPDTCVLVGSGARPLIFAAFACLIDPGDSVVYQVPSWNTHHYVVLSQAHGIALKAHPNNGFVITANDLHPHLATARLVVLNSPQNPSGSVTREADLRAMCEAILTENHRRTATGQPPVMLLYDQVYWQLTFGKATHHHPVGLLPEMANYTIMVDAISKCFAATGIRVGWCVCPPWIRDRLQTYAGHMGAWASRPAQLATAQVLSDPATFTTYLPRLRRELYDRLQALAQGFQAMASRGLPVRALSPQGALYLSVRFDVHQRAFGETTLTTDEAIRALLLERAGVAVVPFTAFGYPDGSGWMRLSVGRLARPEIPQVLGRIETLLTQLTNG